MRVKPADPSAIIRDPKTRRVLPSSGGNVPDNNFWRRRLQSGEVVLVLADAAPIDSGPRPLGNEPLAPLTTRSTKGKL